MIKKKYLLTTGKSTDRLEYYIVDLIKLYLQVYPDDIPGAKDIGFDFIITNTMKSELPDEVKGRVKDLVQKIRSRFNNLPLEVESVDIIDEKKVKIAIKLDGNNTENIEINLFNEDE